MNPSNTAWGDWQPGAENGGYRQELDVQDLGNVIQPEFAPSDGSAPRQPGGQQQQQVDDLANAVAQAHIGENTGLGQSPGYVGAQAGATGYTGYEQFSNYGGSPEYTYTNPAQAQVAVGISPVPLIVNGSNPLKTSSKNTGAETASRSSKAKGKSGGSSSGSKDKDRSSKSSRRDKSGHPRKEKHSSSSTSRKTAVSQQAVQSTAAYAQYGSGHLPQHFSHPVSGTHGVQGPYAAGMSPGVMGAAIPEEGEGEDDDEEDDNDDAEEEEWGGKNGGDDSPEAALTQSSAAVGEGGREAGPPQDLRRPPGRSSIAGFEQAQYLSHEQAAALAATAATGGVGVGPNTGYQEDANVPRNVGAYYNIVGNNAGTATTPTYTMSSAPVVGGGAGMGGVPMVQSMSVRSLGSTYSGGPTNAYGSFAPGSTHGGNLDLGQQQQQQQPQMPGWDMPSPVSSPGFVMDPLGHLTVTGYVIEKSTRFIPGEVFKIYWAEPFGGGNAAAAGGGSRPDTPMIAEEGVRAAGRFFYGVRRFIVIAMDEGHSTCIPILTYGTRGCNKPGVKPLKHGIVYHHGPARPMPGEPELGVAPVRMHFEVDSERLAPESRVNYSKLQTVEHNAPVFFIGYVDARDFEAVVKPAVERLWTHKGREQNWCAGGIPRELQHRRLFREQQQQRHQQQQQQQQQYGQGGYMYTPRG